MPVFRCKHTVYLRRRFLERRVLSPAKCKVAERHCIGDGFIILIMPHLFTSSLRLLELRRLRWRARRGRLENDLIFERFFSRYETALDGSDIEILRRILALSDDVLSNILLMRIHPEGEWATPEMMRMWARLRSV